MVTNPKMRPPVPLLVTTVLAIGLYASTSANAGEGFFEKIGDGPRHVVEGVVNQLPGMGTRPAPGGMSGGMVDPEPAAGKAETKAALPPLFSIIDELNQNADFYKVLAEHPNTPVLKSDPGFPVPVSTDCGILCQYNPAPFEDLPTREEMNPNVEPVPPTISTPDLILD